MRLQGRSRQRVSIGHIVITEDNRRRTFTRETIVFLSKSDSKFTTTTARLACRVKAHKGQRAVVAISGEILAQKPDGMRDCKGQILRVDLKNIREIPPLYVSRNWEERLEKIGFCSAQHKKSGSRIILRKIPVGCWIREVRRREYEICDYGKIQR